MATFHTVETLSEPHHHPRPKKFREVGELSLFPTIRGEDDPSQQDGPSLATQAGAQHVGIARLAASSPLAEAKRGAEYYLLPARSILNRCDSERMPFTWTVNPYRGCEFGCKYCYARYTHEYMDLDGGEFESKIYVKQNAGRLAHAELRTKPVRGEHIAIGTATDPYQPAEREFGATRAILEEIALIPGLSVSITTKSNQVVRDIDVLQRIAKHSSIGVNITITTPRPRLARLLEPLAPRPDLRLNAVRELREAGIPAGVFVIPVLPQLTDKEEDLEVLAREAQKAGALWFCGNVLFLMPSSRKQFFPFLDRKFPRLSKRYRDWYETTGYAPETYSKQIIERFVALRHKYGLKGRPLEPPKAAEAPLQQLTFDLCAQNSGQRC